MSIGVDAARDSHAKPPSSASLASRTATSASTSRPLPTRARAPTSTPPPALFKTKFSSHEYSLSSLGDRRARASRVVPPSAPSRARDRSASASSARRGLVDAPMVTDGGLVDGVDRADVVVDPSLAPNPVTHRGVAPFPKSSPRRAFALSSRVSMSAVRRPSARPSVRSRARDRRRPFPSIVPARFARRRASPSRARDASREKRVARALFRGERFFARSFARSPETHGAFRLADDVEIARFDSPTRAIAAPRSRAWMMGRGA
jgi:hypothetical protein